MGNIIDNYLYNKQYDRYDISFQGKYFKLYLDSSLEFLACDALRFFAFCNIHLQHLFIGIADGYWGVLTFLADSQ